MSIDDVINIEDLHLLAKRKLPKVMFDYIEGGVEDERGLERNAAAFRKHQLLPRYLVDVSKRDQTQTIFGRTFSSPFGISPTGGVGLYQRRGGELLLAEAAAAANIPYIMSGGSNASMEEAARIAPDNTWFQMYAAKDPAVTDALVGRARDNGLGALVLTVDVPVHPRRERNLRNGFANVRRGGVFEALKLKPSIIIEALSHPLWVYDYVRNGGAPTLGNWVPHAGEGATIPQVLDFNRTMTPASAQTWRDLERYRRLFPRTLIVKGILNPADAIRAADIGCDGILVSNHGGRQLDRRLDSRQNVERGDGRRAHDRDARQRRPARRRHIDRDVPRRAVRHLRPPDIVRRGRVRIAGGQEGDRHLQDRDRPRDGPDRLPQP